MENQMDKGAVLAWLHRDKLTHIDMIEPLRQGKAQVLAASEHGVLTVQGEMHFLTADSPAAAMRLMDAAENVTDMLAHQQNYLPQLCERFKMKIDLEVVNAAWFKKGPLPLPASEAEVRQLDTRYLEDVCRHYNLGSREYLSGRLQAGVMLGAFVDGRLAGFVGEHEEGSLGMLEVFPEYRRRGLGRLLAVSVINRQLKAGRVPFGQIVTDNEASLAMQRGMGFEVGTGTLTWLGAIGNSKLWDF